MKTTTAKANGRSIAAFLAGAWRAQQSMFDLSLAEVERLAPLLMATGAGALGWWRVHDSEIQSCGAAEELHQAYRFYTLESILKQSKIERVFAVLRSAGIEAILIKGWAAARYYPEQGLRPYGDIDVSVRQHDYDSAERALAILDPLKFRLDLHSGFAKFGLRRDDDLFAHSELVRLGETEVRILCAEDHLRVVSYHLMREGAWRPLWLVDVAAALECNPPDFDWNYCLSDRRQARSVVSAIGLAHLLLGAKVDHIPEARRFITAPSWLIPTVLKEWGSTMPAMQQRQAAPMLSHLHSQGDVLNGLQHRWPNPIEASTTMNGPFNEFPRFPFQVGNSLFRLGMFLTHLPRALKK